MDWLKKFTQKVRALSKTKTASKVQASLPENTKKPNIVVSGYIDRFSPVIPLHVGDSSDNYYALTLKGEEKIILFGGEIIDRNARVCISLLRSGDYVQCEINPQGWGVLSTLKSTAWQKGWPYQLYHDPNITPEQDIPKDNIKKPSLRVIRGGKP